MSMNDYNYWGDRRVLASMVSPAFDIQSRYGDMAVVQLCESIVEDLAGTAPFPDDWDGEVTVPCNVDVCDMCNGTGRVVNPSIDCGGLTDEDFYDEDPDFEEDYFSGAYDVSCPQCGGKGHTLEPLFSPRIEAAVLQFLRDEAEYAAECAAERRYGC